VSLILRLYDLRREKKLREAREWFAKSFHADGLKQFQKLCPPGSEANAYFRMVVSYWEMVASFITGGVLQQELFFESGREMLFVWVRLREMLPDYRESVKDPRQYENLETVANSYIEWWKERSPDAYNAFVERINAR
jgi:hypothetical protein